MQPSQRVIIASHRGAAAIMLTFYRRYDNCFLKWYSESTSHVYCDWELALINICTEFLRGTATTDDCKPIFEQYEKCLSVRTCAQDELHCS